MPEKFGEKPLEDSPESRRDEKRRKAEENAGIASKLFSEKTQTNLAVDAMNLLRGTLISVEGGEEINLNNPVVDEGPDIIQKEVLEDAVDRLKPYIDFLNPEQRHTADGLIMRAEMYLAAHDPKQAVEFNQNFYDLTAWETEDLEESLKFLEKLLGEQKEALGAKAEKSPLRKTMLERKKSLEVEIKKRRTQK